METPKEIIDSALADIDKTEKEILSMIEGLQKRHPYINKIYPSDGGRGIYFKIGTLIDMKRVGEYCKKLNQPQHGNK